MKKVIYYGVFFDEKESEKLYLVEENSLDKKAKDLHVTFRYFPFPNERINDVVGKEITLKVIGYGNNGRNSAVLVEIPESFKRYYRHRYRDNGENTPIVPHITLSLSNDSTPKESRLLDFNVLEKPIAVTGKFGYYVSEIIDGEKKACITFEKVW